MLLSLSAFACRSAVSIYYVRYVSYREQGVSTFLTASSGAAFCACLLLPFLPSAMLRKRSLALACCGCGAISAAIFYGTTGNWWLTICMQFIFGFCTSALLPLLFGLVAYLPQHLRVLRNRPVEGLIAAGAFLALKLGTLCGTAIAAVALANAGYQPGIEQTRSTLRTFVFLISFLPAIFLLLAGVILSLLPSWETDNQRTLSGMPGEFGID
jgi:Na+/melibiose symporter-like transporter